MLTGKELVKETHVIDSSEKQNATEKQDCTQNDIALELNNSESVCSDINTKVQISESSNGKIKLNPSNEKHRLMFHPKEDLLEIINLKTVTDKNNTTNKGYVSVQKDHCYNQKQKSYSLANKTKPIRAEISPRYTRSIIKAVLKKNIELQNEYNRAVYVNSEINPKNILLKCSERVMSDFEVNLSSYPEIQSVTEQKYEQQENVSNKVRNKRDFSSSSDGEPVHFETVALVHVDAERNINNNIITDKSTQCQSKVLCAEKNKRIKLSTSSDKELPIPRNANEIITEDSQESTQNEDLQVNKLTTKQKRKYSSKKKRLRKKIPDVDDYYLNSSEDSKKIKECNEFLTSFTMDTSYAENHQACKKVFGNFYGYGSCEKLCSFRRRRHAKKTKTGRIHRKNETLQDGNSSSCPNKVKIVSNILLKPADNLRDAEYKFDKLKAKETKLKISKVATVEEKSKMLQESNSIASVQKIAPAHDSEDKQISERLWELLVQNHQYVNNILVQYVPRGKENTEVHLAMVEFNSRLQNIAKK